MRSVIPEVFMIASTHVHHPGMGAYLDAIDTAWDTSAESTAELLIEFAGRLCYRSWAPGLNPNVTKVRGDHKGYIENVLKSRHGSVLEHSSATFVFHNVSRVFTHELVRHRAGCAISQESMRFVRLTDIPNWTPEWAKEDAELQARNDDLLLYMENHQQWMAAHFKLDDAGVPFSEKKAKTSYMRRFAPDGVATGIVWTANFRSLRHILELRTDPAAEEEIRIVFDRVGQLCQRYFPTVFQDFIREQDGTWKPLYSKV